MCPPSRSYGSGANPVLRPPPARRGWTTRPKLVKATSRRPRCILTSLLLDVGRESAVSSVVVVNSLSHHSLRRVRWARAPLAQVKSSSSRARELLPDLALCGLSLAGAYAGRILAGARVGLEDPEDIALGVTAIGEIALTGDGGLVHQHGAACL